MKRSETVLVYGVTALLLFILVVALFTNQDPQPTVGTEADRGRTEEAGRTPPGMGEVIGVDPQRKEESPRETASRQPETPANGPAAAVPLNIAPVSAAALLGPYERDSDTRIVVVGVNDTLSSLVEKWCGSLDYLRETRLLNETITNDRQLRPGQRLAVPWVDDELLLEQRRVRLESGRARSENPATARLPVTDVPMDPTDHEVPPSGSGNMMPVDGFLPAIVRSPGSGNPGSGNPERAPQAGNLQDALTRRGGQGAVDAAGPAAPRAPAAAPAGSSYVIQDGDSLWKIAVSKVGANKANAYIEQIRKANPGLNPARLKPKSSIVLP